MMGTRIAALRVGAGMNQVELAEKIAVSASAIGMYEQGRREPSGERLVRLARLFGVTADYLLTGQPVCAGDREALERLSKSAVSAAEDRQARRRGKGEGFTSQELEVLLPALVAEV